MYDSIKHLIGPSGGISYHYFAWRYRATYWRPFLSQVESWLLKDWNPNSKILIIFGPSAGWSLPFAFLNRFERIICVEPDPLARSLFLKRFSALSRRLEFLSETALMPWFANPFGSTGPLEELLSREPNAAILFANVLGQVPLLLPSSIGEEDHIETLRQLVSTLNGREAASYHDLLSSPNEPLSSRPNFLPAKEAGPNSSQIASQFFPPGSEVVDHETLFLSRNRDTRIALWRIRPGMHHIIGFIRFA
jgi:hypothetical protein